MRRAALPLVLSLGVYPAWAELPGLATYVTDANEDRYVATFGDQAVELDGCDGETAARALLAIGNATPLVVTTFDALTADFSLGTHPAIPCIAQPVEEMAWPADTQIWADLEGSGNYFLAAPMGTGFYTLPRRCDGLKEALALRTRLQRSGVLQGLEAPAAPETRVAMDCGDAQPSNPVGGEGPGAGASASWSLHTIDVLLSDVGVDRIFVARLAPPEGSEEAPRYLPIWRIDGESVAEMFLNDNGAVAAGEAKLKTLLGVAPDAEATILLAEARSAVDRALFVDICTINCDEYNHRHGFYAAIGIDFALTETNLTQLKPGIDRLGRPRLGFAFGTDRHAVFIGCDRIARSVGIGAETTVGWAEAAALAESRAEQDRASAFICPSPETVTCTRRIAQGATISEASLHPGQECEGRDVLDLRLPALSSAAETIALDGTGFAQVVMRPDDGVEVAQLRVTPGRSPSVSACLLSNPESLISARNLPRLAIFGVELAREGEGGGDEVIGIEVENGLLAAEGLTVLGETEFSRPVARGISLCNADLYIGAADINGSAVALQAFGARILGAGTPEVPLALTSDVYGAILSGGTQARLSASEISARNAMVLRTADVTGHGVSMTAVGEVSGDAIQLTGAAKAEFFGSLSRGFRCVATFWSSEPTVRFVLPSNQLSAENTVLACGPGALVIEE